MNTAILSPSGASAGLGFATAIDSLVDVVERLITKKQTDPEFGITMLPGFHLHSSSPLYIHLFSCACLYIFICHLTNLLNFVHACKC